MALIPGIFVKGKFKPYCQCTIEELENAIRKEKIKQLIALGGAGFVIGLAIICLFG